MPPPEAPNSVPSWLTLVMSGPTRGPASTVPVVPSRTTPGHRHRRSRPAHHRWTARGGHTRLPCWARPREIASSRRTTGTAGPRRPCRRAGRDQSSPCPQCRSEGPGVPRRASGPRRCPRRVVEQVGIARGIRGPACHHQAVVAVSESVEHDELRAIGGDGQVSHAAALDVEHPACALSGAAIALFHLAVVGAAVQPGRGMCDGEPRARVRPRPCPRARRGHLSLRPLRGRPTHHRRRGLRPAPRDPQAARRPTGSSTGERGT
jgi:hypothetical protein